MARLSSVLTATSVLAASAIAQQCQPSQTQCATDNESLLLRCDGASWSTSLCPANEYCMTMMPGMIHCMLKPDNGGAAQSSATPTPTASSSSKPTSSSAAPASPSTTAPVTQTTAPSTKTSGAAANKAAAAIGLGVAAVAGLAALF